MFCRLLGLNLRRGLHPTAVHGPKARRVVGCWLAGGAGLVFGIVVLGGVTRLTGSGLSMVDWSLVHFRPPRSEDEWQAYFSKYQQYPEFKLNNADMTVDQFKRIYWMEHAHRVYGRLLGLYLILPGLWFTFRRGWINDARIRRKVVLASGLVVFQGLLGWWMVKSGLGHEIVEKGEQPRVSPYRLAAHLASAFALYGILLTGALDVLRPATPTTLPLRGVRRWSLALSSLVFVTAISGAFVAGLDAGMIYNTFPRMGDRWIPSDIWRRELGLRNAFENPTAAQFNHRCLAMSTLLAVSLFWLYLGRRRLPASLGHLSDMVMATAWLQGTLGLSTLLLSVPISLGSAHQAGSLLLLTSSIGLSNALKRATK